MIVPPRAEEPEVPTSVGRRGVPATSVELDVRHGAYGRGVRGTLFDANGHGADREGDHATPKKI